MTVGGMGFIPERLLMMMMMMARCHTYMISPALQPSCTYHTLDHTLVTFLAHCPGSPET